MKKILALVFAILFAFPLNAFAGKSENDVYEIYLKQDFGIDSSWIGHQCFTSDAYLIIENTSNVPIKFYATAKFMQNNDVVYSDEDNSSSVPPGEKAFLCFDAKKKEYEKVEYEIKTEERKSSTNEGVDYEFSLWSDKKSGEEYYAIYVMNRDDSKHSPTANMVYYDGFGNILYYTTFIFGLLNPGQAAFEKSPANYYHDVCELIVY